MMPRARLHARASNKIIDPSSKIIDPSSKIIDPSSKIKIIDPSSKVKIIDPSSKIKIIDHPVQHPKSARSGFRPRFLVLGRRVRWRIFFEDFPDAQNPMFFRSKKSSNGSRLCSSWARFCGCGSFGSRKKMIFELLDFRSFGVFGLLDGGFPTLISSGYVGNTDPQNF